MAKSAEWKRARLQRAKVRRSSKKKREVPRLKPLPPMPRSPMKDADVFATTPEEWVKSTVRRLLQSFARNDFLIRPLLISLVPRADGIVNQCLLWLDHTSGAEALDSDVHPWRNALATVMVRGFRRDFLAVYQYDGKTDFMLIECGGGGARSFLGQEPSLANFRGPLESEEREALDSSTRARMANAAAVFQRARERGVCLYPTPNGVPCTAKPIRSHSVGRSAHLSRIAEDGHVLGHSRDALRGWLRERDGEIARIGVGAASTFPGFCSTHDHELFDEIDGSPVPLTPRSGALLAYRALCFEIQAKRSMFSVMRELTGLPSLEDLLQDVSILTSHVRRMALGYRDVEIEKREWDRVLATTDLGRVRFHAIRVAQTPEILGSSYLCPEVDLAGEALQDVDSPERAEYVALTVLQDGDGGLIHFSWLNSPGHVGERLIESILHLPSEHRADAVVRLLFMNSDNLFWSPSWWRGLSTSARREVEVLMGVGVVPWLEPLNTSRLVAWREADVVRAW